MTNLSRIPHAIQSERRSIIFGFMQTLISCNYTPPITSDDLVEDSEGDYVINSDGVSKYDPVKNRSEIRRSVYTTRHERIAREAALLAAALNDQVQV